MILRTKIGKAMAVNIPVLLDYLGVKKEAEGVQKVSGDVELIACVPINNEQLSMNNEELALGKGENFAWTLSTYDLDRFGERIDPHGWDFSMFMKNPVIEWAHRYDIPAIGRAESLAVDDDGLHGVIVFNDKSFDPFGWSIGERVKNGVIRAGSVGFRVLEIEIPSKVEWAHRYDIPAIGRAESITVDDDGLHGVIVFNDKSFDPFGWSIGERVKNGVIRAGSVGFRVLEIEIPSKEDSKDGTSLIFRKQELLEFSICNVPANPFALSKQIKNEELEIKNVGNDIADNFWSNIIHGFGSNEQ